MYINYTFAHFLIGRKNIELSSEAGRISVLLFIYQFRYFLRFCIKKGEITQKQIFLFIDIIRKNRYIFVKIFVKDYLIPFYQKTEKLPYEMIVCLLFFY